MYREAWVGNPYILGLHMRGLQTLVLQLTGEQMRSNPLCLRRMINLSFSRGTHVLGLFFKPDDSSVEAEQIVGIGVLSSVYLLSDSCGVIGDLVVHERHRRQGHGRELMLSLLAKARSLGLSRVCLMDNLKDPNRAAALSMCLHLGFQEEKGVLQIQANRIQNRHS